MDEIIPLPPDIEEKLYEQGGLGQKALKAGDSKTAEKYFLAGWECIPEPKLKHDHAASLTVGMTEFYRDEGRFDDARKWLALACEAYGPEPDPYTQFLSATVHYAAGELDEAFALFDVLYKQYKRRPFQGEKPEYLAFYLDRAGVKKSS